MPTRISAMGAAVVSPNSASFYLLRAARKTTEGSKKLAKGTRRRKCTWRSGRAKCHLRGSEYCRGGLRGVHDQTIGVRYVDASRAALANELQDFAGIRMAPQQRVETTCVNVVSRV